MKKAVVSSRFLNQLGMNIILFLAPILILKMTGSAFYAGVALIVEWFPKLIIYIKSSSILSWYKTKKIVLVCNLCRILSIILVMISVYKNNYYILILALPMLQASNAISNILTENLISTWWSKDEWRKGHSLIININLFIALILFPLTLLFSVEIMLYVGLLAFLSGLMIDHFNRNKLYTHFKHGENVDYKEVFKEVYKNKKLISLSILGLAMCVQSVLIYSNMIFFLSDINENLAKSYEFNSKFKAIVGLICILWVFMFVYIKSANTVLKINIMLTFLMNILIYFTNQAFVLVICAGMVQLCFYGYQSISRALRQSLITDGNSMKYTGILIANEAAGILVGGILMLIFAANIKYALLFSSLFLVWSYYNFKSKVSLEEINIIETKPKLI